MGHDLRAEVWKQAYRPTNWLLLGVGVLLSATFGYLVPYAAHVGETSGPPNSNRGLEAMLPGGVVGSAVGGLPVFVGALALIFGVLAVGSEYGWQTPKTVLAQGSSRRAVYAAQAGTILLGTLTLVVALFCTAATASAVIATLEDRPMSWPGALDLATGMAAGWLITSVWAFLGVLLAVLLRSVALPAGLGLVWLLAVQNLVSAIAAPLLDWVADLQTGLPGPNAGSLVASLGAAPATPGVRSLVDAGQATMVLAAYLLAFAVASGWLLVRRDID